MEGGGSSEKSPRLGECRSDRVAGSEFYLHGSCILPSESFQGNDFQVLEKDTPGL